MYSAIIFLLSDQSIWLGTPGYSCHPVRSMVVKPLFLGTLWAEGKGPTQETREKRSLPTGNSLTLPPYAVVKIRCLQPVTRKVKFSDIKKK